jgi:hypothetical protein
MPTGGRTGAGGFRRKLPDLAAGPPMRPPRPPDYPRILGLPPRRPAPPEDRAVQGHRATSTGVPAAQEEEAPADRAARGEEGPAVAVCRAGLARRRPLAVSSDSGGGVRCGGKGAAADLGFARVTPWD